MPHVCAAQTSRSIRAYESMRGREGAWPGGRPPLEGVHQALQLVPLPPEAARPRSPARSPARVLLLRPETFRTGPLASQAAGGTHRRGELPCRGERVLARRLRRSTWRHTAPRHGRVQQRTVLSDVCRVCGGHADKLLVCRPLARRHDNLERNARPRRPAEHGSDFLGGEVPAHNIGSVDRRDQSRPL